MVEVRPVEDRDELRRLFDVLGAEVQSESTAETSGSVISTPTSRTTADSSARPPKGAHIGKGSRAGSPRPANVVRAARPFPVRWAARPESPLMANFGATQPSFGYHREAFQCSGRSSARHGDPGSS